MRICLYILLAFWCLGALVGRAQGGDIIRAEQIRAELSEYGIQSAEFSAHQFEMPSYRWIKRDFLPFYARYLKSSQARYQDEGVDCDNFCVFFQSALFQQNVKSGNISEASSAVGVLYADVGRYLQIRHVLILIRTDRGWFTVEGENGRVTKLKHFIRSNRALKAVF